MKDSESLGRIRSRLAISPDIGLLQQPKTSVQGMLAALRDARDKSRLLSVMLYLYLPAQGEAVWQHHGKTACDIQAFENLPLGYPW